MTDRWTEASTDPKRKLTGDKTKASETVQYTTEIDERKGKASYTAASERKRDRQGETVKSLL